METKGIIGNEWTVRLISAVALFAILVNIIPSSLSAPWIQEIPLFDVFDRNRSPVTSICGALIVILLAMNEWKHEPPQTDDPMKMAYSFNGAQLDYALGKPELKLGSNGVEVELLQRTLNAVGGKLKLDGVFGQDTEGSVKDFQKKNGLKETGIVDDRTRLRLGILFARFENQK